MKCVKHVQFFLYKIFISIKNVFKLQTSILRFVWKIQQFLLRGCSLFDHQMMKQGYSIFLLGSMLDLKKKKNNATLANLQYLQLGRQLFYASVFFFFLNSCCKLIILIKKLFVSPEEKRDNGCHSLNSMLPQLL